MENEEKTSDVKSFYAEDTVAEEAAEDKKYLLRLTSPKDGTERQVKLSSGMFKFGVFSLIFGSLLLIGTGGFTIYSALNFRANQSAVTEMETASEIQQEQLLTLSKKAGKLSEQLQNLTQMENELRIQAGMTPIVEKKAEETSETPIETTDGAAPSETSANASSETPSAETSTETLNETSIETPVDSAEEYNGQGGPFPENVAALKIAQAAQQLSLENATIETPLETSISFEDVGAALAQLEDGIIERRGSLVHLQDDLKKQREQIATIVNQRSAMAATPMPMQSITMPGAVSGSFAGSALPNNSFALGLSNAASNVPAIWPTTGVVTSPYGLRWGGTDFHPGIDIANDMGTPIVATADGVVIVAGWNSGGYGNMVDIDHGNGIMTRYGHASQVVVSAGQYVRRGQVIALMGSTGFSTGPHVHYEVHVNGQRVNPISYL